MEGQERVAMHQLNTLHRTLVVVAGLTLAACGSSDGGNDLHGEIDAAQGAFDLSGLPQDDLTTTDASPIVVPPNTWTWVELGDNFCDDGSVTGIGVNVTNTSKLLVYFEGGGACGDFASCYQANTATHGPFTKAEFTARLASGGGSIFDRNVGNNPFAGYSLVYIPYCTGDVHSGNRVATYSLGADVRQYHHVGHTNALHALDRLTATFPNVTTVVITGSSAGGFGSAINYASYRAQWPQATAYLIDDSGPLFDASVTPSLLRNWYASWGVLDWITMICPDCATSTSKLYDALSAHFPNDRMALLSSLQDSVVRAFYGMQPAAFQTALLRLSANELDPLPRFRRFFVTGGSHTMLGSPSAYTAKGVVLWTWLSQMVTDDPAWTAVAP